MPKSIVVFGGSGFIGAHLLRHLVSKGTNSIISFDLNDPKEMLAGVTYRVADVRNLHDVNVESDVSRIYNLAAIHTTPGHADHEYFETNVAGALEITSFAARHGISEIIFTSSISVYGPGESVKTEETPLEPASSYGHSKALAERIHQNWFDGDSSRRLTIVRPAVVFGKGEGGNFTRLARLLQKGFFVYPGRKNTVKACIYVGDLLDAIEFARSSPERFVLFNACYPDRYTIEDIVTAFRSTSFPNAREFLIPEPAVKAAAGILKPFSALGLGIHPDRVMKLVRSTDIVPGWLQSKGQAQLGQLQSALLRWRDESSGLFT
ncbi:NAD-dependent epimerase/dehydratase family protein [Bradyrhizobium yuanmingense]|uniref:NAD-dependent epimerase/dehydratase family protein n=1 Tax=Bradyrhizobium yuanmingense TaxID=108015 RepID=UPI0023B9CBB8|nr:NAD(P)-dependent oxidoreductase [Bradyrhizobium yuanmingense]MDF0578892.1 NAD(P)-dependent oxidoreductase [Bradyrhizobium yuanmingense]